MAFGSLSKNWQNLASIMVAGRCEREKSLAIVARLVFASPSLQTGHRCDLHPVVQADVPKSQNLTENDFHYFDITVVLANLVRLFSEHGSDLGICTSGPSPYLKTHVCRSASTFTRLHDKLNCSVNFDVISYGAKPPNVTRRFGSRLVFMVIHVIFPHFFTINEVCLLGYIKSLFLPLPLSIIITNKVNRGQSTYRLQSECS